MWRLTQRVFKNGQLIGYVLTEENGLDEKILPKATVWELASNNFVLGVKPLKDGSIVGINGFELKKLPKYTEKKSESTLSEKRQERTKAVITIQDLMTAYLRKILRTENLGLFNSPDYCYMDELRKAFGEIIFEGDKGKSTRNSLSDTLNIEASIVDKHKNKIIGYIVKNNGTIDLEYQRILYKNYNTRIKRVLKPGEKVGLSVAEIVLLSSINKISMKFNNGKVINSIINQNLKTKFKVLKDSEGKVTDLYELLETFELELDNNNGNMVDIHSANINQLIRESDIVSYFGITSNKNGETNIFNMFKR